MTKRILRILGIILLYGIDIYLMILCSINAVYANCMTIGVMLRLGSFHYPITGGGIAWGLWTLFLIFLGVTIFVFYQRNKKIKLAKQVKKS